MSTKKAQRVVVPRSEAVKITKWDVGAVASTLPLIAGTEELNLSLATELAADILSHFRYVRLLLYDVVDRNPFHTVRPRTAKAEKANSIVRQLSFHKYLRGLVLVVSEGSPSQKASLLGDIYARCFEDYITWAEFRTILTTHVASPPQELVQLLQEEFEEKATLVKDSVPEAVLHRRAYEPMIPITDYEQLVASYEPSFDFEIDMKALVRAMKRFQMADSMELSAAY